MSIRYNCSHLDEPHPPQPPSKPSSSSTHHPLKSLYFCEECDAIRCDLCVSIEVASYFCPNCLFDVPSANVRGDKNRCARNCFSCPSCSTSLSVQTVSGFPTRSDITSQSNSENSGENSVRYLLSCSGCKWSSKEIGWIFDKPTGLATQVQKLNTQSEKVQSEYDSIKDHLENFMTSTAAPPSSVTQSKPTRHISHLTQMAAKALDRKVPGMLSAPRGRSKKEVRDKWDEIENYESKNRCRDIDVGVERIQEGDGWAKLEDIWGLAWVGTRSVKSLQPQRIKLQTKLTKRCPHPSCRHLLIQPDTKTTRMKIKMVASNYLPAVELGRRRRLVIEGDGPGTIEDMELRRKERRRGRIAFKEEEEGLSDSIRPGVVYNFQIAFTNPLYDPIQIRLTRPKSSIPSNHHIYIPTQHFTVAASKDVWGYEDEEEEDHLMHGSEDASEEGGTVSGVKGSSSTISKRSRLSVLGMGSVREKRDKGRESGVEKKGNISKVGLEVEIMPEARGKIETDLEVRYTYRSDDSESAEGKKEYKTFTFWIRVGFGEVINYS